MIDDALISFLKQLPKIELHAHLNGCIRESTLLELAEERNVTLSPLHHDLQRKDENEDQYPPESTVVAAATSECFVKEQVVDINNNKVNKKQRSLQQCFEIFAEISKCVTDLNALKRITEEALEDFAHQNVAYLELRSTPKELYYDIKHEKKATKKDYVDTILQAMENFENGEKMKSAHSIMIPRFIISVNRGESNDNAMDNADLAIQYKNQNNKYVVGLDLSGNPLKSQFHDIEPAFSLVRDAGLKTSIHFGEIQCVEENDHEFANKDANAILSFRPDRLGHSLLLTESMFTMLDSLQIPVECCPTSNVMTLELAKHFEGDLVHGLKRHPRLKSWIENRYPISINTDDPGIFNTNSTLELVLLAEAFDLKNPDIIVKIIENSIEHIFESSAFKQQFKKNISHRVQSLMKEYYGKNLN